MMCMTKYHRIFRSKRDCLEKPSRTIPKTTLLMFLSKYFHLGNQTRINKRVVFQTIRIYIALTHAMIITFNSKYSYVNNKMNCTQHYILFAGNFYR